MFVLTPRWLIEKHTEDPIYAYRVRDTTLSEEHEHAHHGFGLTSEDALSLAIALDIWHTQPAD